MKNTLKTAAVIALALVVAFSLVGCGESPEGLAKQFEKLTNDYMKAIGNGDIKKLEQIQKRGEILQKKVEAMSEENQQKFYEALGNLF